MTKDIGPTAQFSDELYALIQRWREKPLDDRLICNEMVGALQYEAFELMMWSREQVQT